jgi:hypothetical protein
LPTVALDSEPTPERFSEPGFRLGERRPLMLGDMRRAPLLSADGDRKLPMLGDVRSPPREGEWRLPMLGEVRIPPIDGEWRLPMLGEDRKPPKDGEPPMCMPPPLNPPI